MKKKNRDGQDEDTKEQIMALEDEIEAALKDLPADSEEVKNASKLLVKLHGFVAKLLCAWFYNIWVTLFLSTADESDEVSNVDKDQPQYDLYKFTLEEWELMTKIKKVMNVSSSYNSVMPF